MRWNPFIERVCGEKFIFFLNKKQYFVYAWMDGSFSSNYFGFKSSPGGRGARADGAAFDSGRRRYGKDADPDQPHCSFYRAGDAAGADMRHNIHKQGGEGDG